MCSGRPHAILCSPEGSEATSTNAKRCWLEARAFACSGGLRVLCALCCHSGECCGKMHLQNVANRSRDISAIAWLCSTGGQQAGASTPPA